MVTLRNYRSSQPTEADLVPVGDPLRWAVGKHINFASGPLQDIQRRRSNIVVWASILDLFAATPEHLRLDLDHWSGGTNAQAIRIIRAREFWASGRYMDPSDASFDPEGEFRFGDGRHRLHTAYRLGHKYGPVVVPRNQLDQLHAVASLHLRRLS